MDGSLPILKPDLQIAFYHRLQTLRGRYLQDALRQTVASMEIKEIDGELARLVPPTALARVASYGIRGETFFPVPCLLMRSPNLLGYYRLLIGMSQKEFYNKGAFGPFKRMEEKQDLGESLAARLPVLCRSLIGSGLLLVEAMAELSLGAAHDLQLLTLGPQLRGRENTRIGQAAMRNVFSLLEQISGPYLMESTKRTLLVKNKAGSVVQIEFSSDPDIQITEQLPTQLHRIVSIEIKGGADSSNMHNRLGEAEKSHQKAKSRGFHEFWTVMKSNVKEAVARQESPTTSRFFSLEGILDPSSGEHRSFVDLVKTKIGIRGNSK